MRISDIISKEMVVAQLRATSKAAIIDELAQHIAQKSPDIDAKVLSQVLRDREALASTAIGHGVAIPHGKLPELDGIKACIGRARDGVDFESMDGKPTHIFIVIVAPETSTGEHLKVLARISRIFKDSDFMRRLLESPSADEMYKILDEEDQKYC